VRLEPNRCMSPRIQFRGPFQYRLKNISHLGQGPVKPCIRRSVKCAKRPGLYADPRATESGGLVLGRSTELGFRHLRFPFDIRNCFCYTNCLFEQLPRVNCLTTPFTRQVGVQLSLGFFEGIFGSQSSALCCLIGLSNLLRKASQFGIDAPRFGFLLTMRSSAAGFWRRLFIGGFQVAAPTLFDCLTEFVQSRVSLVGRLSHFALLKQPLEDRPVCGLAHQCSCILDFGQFFHSAMNIDCRIGKVQRRYN